MKPSHMTNQVELLKISNLWNVTVLEYVDQVGEYPMVSIHKNNQEVS